MKYFAACQALIICKLHIIQFLRDQVCEQSSFSVIGNILLEIFSKCHNILNDTRRFEKRTARPQY